MALYYKQNAESIRFSETWVGNNRGVDMVVRISPLVKGDMAVSSKLCKFQLHILIS